MRWWTRNENVIPSRLNSNEQCTPSEMTSFYLLLWGSIRMQHSDPFQSIAYKLLGCRSQTKRPRSSYGLWDAKRSIAMRCRPLVTTLSRTNAPSIHGVLFSSVSPPYWLLLFSLEYIEYRESMLRASPNPRFFICFHICIALTLPHVE